MGIQWRQGPGLQRKEDPGSRRRRKEAAYPSSEEVGDFEERGWGLEDSAAAFSIHPDAWPLPDLQGRGQTPCLCGERYLPRDANCLGLGPAPGARRGFSGPGLSPEGSEWTAWKWTPRKEGTTARSSRAVRSSGGGSELSLEGAAVTSLLRSLTLPAKWRRLARVQVPRCSAEGPSFRQC